MYFKGHIEQISGRKVIGKFPPGQPKYWSAGWMVVQYKVRS